VRWSRNLALSVRALGRSRSRTVLSLGAVAIGIASVVVLIGAGVGAEHALLEALEALGQNLLVVNPARSQTDALRGISRDAETLTLEDAVAIAEGIPEISNVAPVAERTILVSAEGRSLPAKVIGTTPEFEEARNYPMNAGRFIDEQDLEEASRVVVVGALVIENLFDGELPLGETLFLQGVPFRIIGVYKKKGIASNGSNEDELLIVPVTTAMRRLLEVDSLSRVFVQADSESAVPRVEQGINSLLRERHSIASGEDDFSVHDQTATVRAQQEASGTFRRIVPGLSALSLALGGVGLLAVCLLSVRERYTEIGLRLAVGAVPRDILVQFLTEALLISLAGGLLGLMLGAGGIAVGSAMTSWPMVLSWKAVVYPFGISVAIAVIFGAWPAMRAARLDPILALNSR
jgi:putative ABC transport system permease protein